MERVLENSCSLLVTADGGVVEWLVTFGSLSRGRGRAMKLRGYFDGSHSAAHQS